jgi:hypothetical protein
MLSVLDDVVRFERMITSTGQNEDGTPFVGFARYEVFVSREELGLPPSMGMAYDFYSDNAAPLRLISANIVTRVGQIPSDEELEQAKEEGGFSPVIADVFLHAEQAGGQEQFESICDMAERSGWKVVERRIQ